MRLFLGSLFIFFTLQSTYAQPHVLPGAAALDQYLPLIKNKRVGIFANQTSVVPRNQTEWVHLVDTLMKREVTIQRIFGPEHGFRGNANAGEQVGNYTDEASGIPVISLYGKKDKPTKEDLKDIDVLLFDIQDVGVRFYTYISSLQRFMEAAFECKIPLIILDRPNPNGFYVDGPVLQKEFTSFVGMQPIPIVYGMTMGEYASMLVSEKWLSAEAIQSFQIVQKKFKEKQGGNPFLVIKCEGYSHDQIFPLPVNPSPNLSSLQSILLYPSTCLFEGTTLSEGRGTDNPFQIFGAPSLPKNLFAFVPKPNAGAKSGKHFNDTCYGWNLSGSVDYILSLTEGKIQLKWLRAAYQLFPDKNAFFILPKSGKMEASFFNKLAGNNTLWQQIKDGLSDEEIRKSWEPELTNFKKIRKKYLLYPDFSSTVKIESN